MTTGRRRKICAGFVGGLLIAATLFAGSGGTAASTVKARNKHGLNVTVDSRGIESDGYRPIRVKITPWPPVPSTSERSIRIAVQPNYYDVGAVDTEVSQVFELKAGGTSVEGTVLVPQDRVFGFILVHVYEDGERLSGMEMRLNSSRGGYWNYSGNNTSILFIDSDAFTRDRQATAVVERTSGRWKGPDTFLLPDVRNLSALFPDPHSGQVQAQMLTVGDGELPKQPDIATIALVNDHSRFDLVPPAELPDDWLALTGYDVIYIDRQDLLLVAEKFPERLQAIIDWLETGSLLLVADGGREFEHLDALEKLLHLPPAPADEQTPSKTNRSGWIFPNEKDLEKAATPNQVQPGLVYRNGRPYYNNGTEVDPLSLTKDEQANLIKKPPYAFRAAGLGCLAVFRDERPLSGQTVTWRALFASAGNQRMRWQERHGISSNGRNPGYWSFLIPGVGMAPVMAFLLLISLFMLLVGPVNYWFLRRARRTHLLLLTVPAGALVMTVGLFLYALITDGLGVSSRIRSFTWLDQRGRAVSWSRHSYYASLSPAKGLVFPADAAAYSIVPDAWRTQHASRQRKMRWEDDEQQLQAGYVQPRTVTQFLVLRATDTKQALKWSAPSAKSAAPEVTNELGVKIELLLAKNEAGELFRGENIEPGAKAKLVLQPTTDAKTEWKMLCTRNEPKALHADDSHDQNLMSFLLPDFSYGQWIETQGVESSLLEKRLHSAKDGDPAAGTWIAQTARSAAVPIAVDYAVEKAGFHLMGGSW